MLERHTGKGDPQKGLRKETLEKYRRAAIARETFLLRRQRKEILEKARRIAIIGASADPRDHSYVCTEKLLGLGVEVAVVLPDCETYLGLPCYARLRDVPGTVDIVQVYPEEDMDLTALAREAVEKSVSVFWVDQGPAGPEAKEILADGQVQVVENEALDREYIKHLSYPSVEYRLKRPEKRSITVEGRMTRNPVTVKAGDGIKDAMEKMKRGHFRHLPVVDDEGRLIGMLSDRDIRLIRPSLIFISPEDAALQLWSTSVRQAAVFDPVTIYPEALLEQAAELMLRWEVGGLPVVDKAGDLVGIITYTDLLRGFVAG